MVLLEELARVAEIEFSDMVEHTETIGAKLRVVLIEDGFVDVWLSRKLGGRFVFHWEQESTALSYRYDNFPNTQWKHVSTYPFHFTDSSHFEKDITDGFRGFTIWVRSKISKPHISPKP